MRAAILRPRVPAPRYGAAALVVGLALGACGQWDDQNRALVVAREELGCFDVALERTESHRWHAEGCGASADIACSEGSLNPVCIRVAERTTGGEAPEVVDEVVDDAVEAPDETTVAHGAEPAATEAEAAIRRGLDARANDILACVDRDSVAVRVSHAADGLVTVTLSGDLRGTPEEGCVRAALGDVRAPSGAAGVVVHLVRAHRPMPELPPAETTLEAPPAEPAPTTLTGAVVEELD